MNDTLIQDSSIKVAGQAITKTTETGEQTELVDVACHGQLRLLHL
jgi:hypothetical protein